MGHNTLDKRRPPGWLASHLFYYENKDYADDDDYHNQLECLYHKGFNDVSIQHLLGLLLGLAVVLKY